MTQPGGRRPLIPRAQEPPQEEEVQEPEQEESERTYILQPSTQNSTQVNDEYDYLRMQQQMQQYNLLTSMSASSSSFITTSTTAPMYYQAPSNYNDLSYPIYSNGQSVRLPMVAPEVSLSMESNPVAQDIPYTRLRADVGFYLPLEVLTIGREQAQDYIRRVIDRATRTAIELLTTSTSQNVDVRAIANSAVEQVTLPKDEQPEEEPPYVESTLSLEEFFSE